MRAAGLLTMTVAVLILAGCGTYEMLTDWKAKYDEAMRMYEEMRQLKEQAESELAIAQAALESVRGELQETSFALNQEQEALKRIFEEE